MLRVIAAAVAHERTFGEVPSAAQVIALAEAEGASIPAALVAVRWELFDKEGRIVRLDTQLRVAGPVVDEDTATLWALEAFSVRRIHVGLRSIEGSAISKHSLVFRAQGAGNARLREEGPPHPGRKRCHLEHLGHLGFGLTDEIPTLRSVRG